MHYALDEMFDVEAARVLNLLARRYGDEVSYLLDFAPRSTEDLDIPALCDEHGIGVLITVNYKDFGAKKALYQTLLDQGVHVVVLRPGKQVLYTETQVALISGSYRSIRMKLSEVQNLETKLLLRVTQSGVVQRTLEELIAEFAAPTVLP